MSAERHISLICCQHHSSCVSPGCGGMPGSFSGGPGQSNLPCQLTDPGLCLGVSFSDLLECRLPVYKTLTRTKVEEQFTGESYAFQFLHSLLSLIMLFLIAKFPGIGSTGEQSLEFVPICMNNVVIKISVATLRV